MRILQVGTMPDGTKVQIEDWSKLYGFMRPASTLAAYPKAKVSLDGQFAPKRNERFRVAFYFEDEAEARQAYEDLIAGSKQLIDFKDCINNPRNIECL